jgi:hypothetical protein
VSIGDVIEAIAEVVPASAGSITFDDVGLPFPEEADSGSFADVVPGFETTPLAEGVRTTVERFRALVADGILTAPAT